MRVLFATSIIRKKGDVDAFLLDILKELAEKVEHIYLLCLQSDLRNIKDNITIIVNPFTFPLLKIIWLFWTTLKITYTKKIGVYICFISEIVCIILSVCSLITGKKTFFWYCSVYPVKKLKHILAIKLSSYILTCSEIVKQYYERLYNININKIYNIGHGIAVEKFHSKPNYQTSQKTINSNQITIVSVARISPIKKWEKLIYAVSMLKRKNVNVRVVAVGSPGAYTNNQIYYKNLQQIIKDLDLEDTWSFVGHVPNLELAKFYSLADVIVLTGFAYKTILEALAMGKITLFEKKSAQLIFPHHIVEKANILTFTDSTSLFGCLSSFLDNRHEFISVSSMLSDFVRREFSCNRYVSKIVELFYKLK